MSKNKKDLPTIITNVEKNKNSIINVTNNYGNVDKLSFNEISNNRKNIKEIAENFSERIKFSCDIISSANLPKELQNDFYIKPKIINDELEYSTEPKTKDAYKKFPPKINFKMNFDSVEEKNEFIKDGGMKSFVEEANRTRKPVKIPNITEMKDFLGDFENPTSKINNQNVEQIQLFVLPEEFPKAESYSIELFDNDICFKVEHTSLRVVEKNDNYFIIDNSESVDEPFDISLKFTNNKERNKTEIIKVTTNITISIRENYKNSVFYNLEFEKFVFTINSSNATMIIKNLDRNIELIRADNIGKEQYLQKQYDFFGRLYNLLSNVLFIDKKYGLNINYDLKEFEENEDYINILASDVKNKKYKLYRAFSIGLYLDKYDENIHTNFIVEIPGIVIFGKEFELKHNKMLFKNSKCIKEEIKDGKNIVHLESKDIEYNVVDNTI